MKTRMTNAIRFDGQIVATGTKAELESKIKGFAFDPQNPALKAWTVESVMVVR